jgi:hypothetical protein
LEIASLVLDYIKVIIWPATVLVVVYLFKEPLLGLLKEAHNAEFSVAGINVTLDRKLDAVEGTLSSSDDREAEKPKNPKPFPVEVDWEDFKLRPVHGTDAPPPGIWGWPSFMHVVIEISEALGLRMSNNPPDGQFIHAKAFLEDLRIWNTAVDDIAELVRQTYLALMYHWKDEGERVSKAEYQNRAAMKNAERATRLVLDEAKRYWESHPELPVLTEID